MEIKSLATTDFHIIFEAFHKAFADYELQLTKEQLRTMFHRRGFNPGLSFAAFDGEEIVAFTCNGTGNFAGQFTAYDTGTGTLPNYRGKGLATQIFEYSIPYLKKQGIQQYLLEVLQHNTKAVSVYRKLGFEVVREFYYFNQLTNEVRNKVKMPPIPYEIRPIKIETYEEISTFQDFYPSWQNSPESILRSPDDFISSGLFVDNELVGYSVFDPTSGDITQLAIRKSDRRKGFGSILLQKMLESNQYESIKAINTDIKCDAVKSFLEAKNILLRGKQFEMIKPL
ncbi:MAG: GNAT family N-acetyltransferase [Tannerellaceae bacterium]|nr:GNAT family N-acetyltransferase [Tannerellaceae bacterium]